MSEPALKVVDDPEAPQPVVIATVEQPIKLDLGCGQNPREGFEGVDIGGDVAKYKQDLLKFPWQWATSSVDEINCSHFIEHIPQANDETGKNLFFAFFDECYRVLKPKGTMSCCWPALQSVRAFQDPTHTRYVPAETMLYLSDEWRELNKLDHYRVDCNFAVSVNPTVQQAETLRHPVVGTNRMREMWNVAVDFHAVLTAIKP